MLKPIFNFIITTNLVLFLTSPAYSQVFELENKTQKIQKEEVIVDLRQGVDIQDKDVLFVQQESEDEIKLREKSLSQSISVAFQSKNYLKIKEYISNGVSINNELYNGNTIVNISAFHKDIQLLKFASENGAKLINSNNAGENILYSGSTGKNIEYLVAMKSLLNKKDFESLLNRETKNGRSPLHAAMLYAANKDVISWLISEGVNVNKKDVNGQTALHYAIALGKWDMLIYLLQKNGNIKEVDKDNKTVEDYIFDRINLDSMIKVYPYVSVTRQKQIDSMLASINTTTLIH
ncbi:hypothetical protein GW796_07050 [archaeon]|nr:hypothetical protein [archaeon]